MIYIYIQYKHLISPDDFLPRLTSRFSPISTHQESEVSNPNIDDEVQGQLRITEVVHTNYLKLLNVLMYFHLNHQTNFHKTH